jgi:hypothetical protein
VNLSHSFLRASCCYMNASRRFLRISPSNAKSRNCAALLLTANALTARVFANQSYVYSGKTPATVE